MDQQDPKSNEMREKEKINLWEAKGPKHKENTQWGDSNKPSPTRNQPAVYNNNFFVDGKFR